MIVTLPAYAIAPGSIVMHGAIACRVWPNASAGNLILVNASTGETVTWMPMWAQLDTIVPDVHTPEAEAIATLRAAGLTVEILGESWDH